MASRYRTDDGWGLDTSRTSLTDFVRPVTQMAAAPAKALLYSLDAMASPMRSISRFGNGDTSDPNSLGMMAGLMPFAAPQTDDDQDLSGDDVKGVSFHITFTKPDYVAPLQPMGNAVIDYSTDGGNFAAIKIADFAVAARMGRVEPPSGFDDTIIKRYDDGGWEIHHSERRYITLSYKVDFRLPPQRRHYERDSLKLKRELVHEVRHLVQRLG